MWLTQDGHYETALHIQVAVLCAKCKVTIPWNPDLIKITLLHKRVSRMASSERNTRRYATFYEVQREEDIKSALSNWRLASNIRPETTWNQAREIIC
jgi:hypothetical protein